MRKLLGGGFFMHLMFLNSGAGSEGGPTDTKEQVLAQVKAQAEKTVKERLGDLLKAELSSEDAKKAILDIVSDVFKSAKLTDPVDNTDKTISEMVEAMQKQHNDLSKVIDQLTSENIIGMSQDKKIAKFVAENVDEIKKIQKAGHGVIEFKVVGDMTAGNAVVTSGGIVGTAGSATNPDGIPALVGVQMAPPTRVNLRNAIIDSMVNRFSTSLAAYPYTESVPKDGDFSFVAEGGSKPQIDFKIETRYAQPVKVAAYVHLSEESVQDIPGLQSIATGYLRSKHDLKKQNGILFGDGTSPDPKGATLYGRDFVAGDMANKVRFVNFMDVVNAAITDIYTTHNFQDEMPYQANLVLINPIDFFTELVSAKDERGLPLYPSASLFNRVVIGGVTIMPEETIPSGKIFVADMSKYNVSDYMGYTIKIGWINDDLIKNQFVIVGESRFHAYVKKLDEQAFIYDDIETIKTAISATV